MCTWRVFETGAVVPLTLMFKMIDAPQRGSKYANGSKYATYKLKSKNVSRYAEKTTTMLQKEK